MGTISLQIPVSGQPNSTEDPKVASDFATVQTVINGNIDTNNISPTAGITFAQVSLGVPARAYRNAGLTALGTNWSKVPVDTKSFDPGGAFDVTTNFRYNVPATGYYMLAAQVNAQLNNNPQLAQVGVWKNNVTSGTLVCSAGVMLRGGTGGDPMVLSVADLASLNSGDFLELAVFNTGGNTMTLTTTLASSNYLSVIRVA